MTNYFLIPEEDQPIWFRLLVGVGSVLAMVLVIIISVITMQFYAN